MHKEYDFSKAKRAKNVAHLAKLQKENNGKTRITIMIDNDILDTFRELAEHEGTGYQTLINNALRQITEAKPAKTIDEKTLRKVIREELGRT